MSVDSAAFLIYAPNAGVTDLFGTASEPSAAAASFSFFAAAPVSSGRHSSSHGHRHGSHHHARHHGSHHARHHHSGHHTHHSQHTHHTTHHTHSQHHHKARPDLNLEHQTF